LRWIEKEESDGEILRHMLNFLNSHWMWII
jgi:hypothetical protein